jgi:hypothetical protein
MAKRRSKEDEELLTVKECADESGVTEMAIRNAIWRGKLPSVEKYGRVLVERAALDAYRATARPGRPSKEAITTQTEKASKSKRASGG